MPTPLPSASRSTLLNQASRASTALWGSSTITPINEVQGACTTSRQKYSSVGRVVPGIGLAAAESVALVGITQFHALLAPSAAPFGFSHGKRKRFPAG